MSADTDTLAALLRAVREDPDFWPEALYALADWGEEHGEPWADAVRHEVPHDGVLIFGEGGARLDLVETWADGPGTRPLTLRLTRPAPGGAVLFEGLMAPGCDFSWRPAPGDTPAGPSLLCCPDGDFPLRARVRGEGYDVEGRIWPPACSAAECRRRVLALVPPPAVS